MVRIKMPLKLIEGERHRNATFMKRRVVIKKKTMELGKLCDIVTLFVCFGPRGQLETWPEDQQEVRSIIGRYRGLRPDECITRRYDLATFFECHLKRLQAELVRERSSWLDGLPVESLEGLGQSLDAKLAALDEKINHARLEQDESRGKEIEVWGRHPQSQTQGMEEVTPQFASVLPGLPFGTVILDVPAIQSFEGLDFSWAKTGKFGEKGPQGHAAAWEAPHGPQRSGTPCMLAHSPPDPYTLVVGGLPAMDAVLGAQSVRSSEGLDLSRVKLEMFRGKGLQGHAAAGGGGWEAPHDLQRSETPCSLPYSTSDPCTLPLIPDLGFDMDVGYLDEPIFSNPFLGMDFAAHPTAGAACASSVVDVLNLTTTAFPLGYGSAGSGMGTIRDWNLPPFDQPVDGGHGFSLHHLPADNPAVACNEACRQNDLYRTDDQFFYAGQTAGTSLAETWSTSMFHHQPPAGCCSSSESVQAAAPGRDESSKFMPTSAKNPYA